MSTRCMLRNDTRQHGRIQAHLYIHASVHIAHLTAHTSYYNNERCLMSDLKLSRLEYFLFCLIHKHNISFQSKLVYNKFIK